MHIISWLPVRIFLTKSCACNALIFNSSPCSISSIFSIGHTFSSVSEYTLPATFSLVTLQLQITSLSDAMRPSRTTEGIAVGTASALMRQFVADIGVSLLHCGSFLRCWEFPSLKMRHPRMALTSGVLDKKADYDADELIIELGPKNILFFSSNAWN